MDSRVLALCLIFLGGWPTTGLTAQEAPSQTPPTWSLGPSVSVGGRVPTYVVEDYCGASHSYAFGLVGAWIPSERVQWLGIEQGLTLVHAPPDHCAMPDYAPEGERRVIEPDLSAPFGAFDSRVTLKLPPGSGNLRVHVGAGSTLGEFRPLLSRGVGLEVRKSRLSASLILDWWTLWPGGEEFHETWDEEGTERERIGPFDEWFHVRFVRFSLGWVVG